MRFIPTTFMQSGDCVKAYSNGSTSGSFTSGSDVFQYHEWKLSDRNVSETYQLVVTQGFTSRARAVLIAGGGGGGWNGVGSYGLGGGGGAGQVIDTHNLQLYPTTYSLRVGHGGLPADADNSNPALRTYNGGDGDYTEINGGSYTGGSVLRAIGGDGGYGDQSQTGTYLHGGDSGNGFTGGANDNNYAGGGAGASQNGEDGQDTPSTDRGGNGGNGVTITLPFTSNIWGTTSKDVAGGGGGSADFSNTQGFGTHGGGDGSRKDAEAGEDAERYTGAGGGGGANFSYTPPNGEGTQGGDGVLIIYYPITNCTYFAASSSLYQGNTSINACSSTSSATVYYSEGQTIDVGTRLYQDILFEYPYSSTYFKSGSEWFYISGSNGEITLKGNCPNEFTVYFNSDSSSACSQTTPTNIYSTSSVVELDSVVYYDSNLISPVTQSYFADGNETTSTWYFVSQSNGIVTLTGSCDPYVSGAIVDVFVNNTGSYYSTQSQITNFSALTDSITLEIWSKNSLVGNYDTLIGIHDNVAGGDRDFVEIRQTNAVGPQYVIGTYFDGTTDTSTQPNGPGVNTSTWYHNVLTLNNSTDTLLYYRNTVLIGSASISQISTDLNNPYFVVGQKDNGTNTTVYAGEYRIYKQVLNQSQIIQNYSASFDRYI